MKVQAYVPELIEAGWYKARVKSITPETGQYGPQLKWVFEIVAEPYAGQSLSAWVNTSMNTTGKLVQWGCAALGEVPSEDTEFETEDCLGKLVEVQVIEKTGTDGKVFNKVMDVRPPKKGKGKPKPKDEEEDVEPVDDPFDKD